MIIRSIAKISNVEHWVLHHPNFEHFDRGVTLLVFVDLVIKSIGHMFGLALAAAWRLIP